METFSDFTNVIGSRVSRKCWDPGQHDIIYDDQITSTINPRASMIPWEQCPYENTITLFISSNMGYKSSLAHKLGGISWIINNKIIYGFVWMCMCTKISRSMIGNSYIDRARKMIDVTEKDK